MPQIQAIADRIVQALQGLYGPAWDNLLSAADRRLIAEVALGGASVLIRAMTGENVARDRAQLDAQIANLAAVAAGDAVELFARAMSKVLLLAIAAAVAPE